MSFFVLAFFLFCYCCHFSNTPCWHPGEVGILRSSVSPWYRLTFPSLSSMSSLDLQRSRDLHLLSFPFSFLPVLNFLCRWSFFLRLDFSFPQHFKPETGFQGDTAFPYTCSESNRGLENRFHVPWLLQRSRDGKGIQN